MSSRALKNASSILVVNENTKQIMSSYYNLPKEKIVIVPNGVDLLFFKSEKRDFKKIIFSGVMYHHRGLDVLLDAAPKIINKIPDVKFILLGNGPEMQKLQSIVQKKNLEKHVKFEGWIDRKILPSKIADASIAIGPLKKTTVTENALPIKVLEYMASSLPIIAKIGTLPNDVLENEHNGLFVCDANDLADKIIELLENPDKINAMGKNSLNMVQKFSWEKVVNSIISIYDKL